MLKDASMKAKRSDLQGKTRNFIKLRLCSSSRRKVLPNQGMARQICWGADSKRTC